MDNRNAGNPGTDEASAEVSRRTFLGRAGVVGASLMVAPSAAGRLRELQKPIRLGVIADLHQDVMHDGPERLQAFLAAMATQQPDALIQLGDFAYPTEENRPVTDAFREAHPRALNVLGNHEIDGGHSFDEVAELWGMPGRYYVKSISGLNLIVLDGNEKPPGHQRGYPAHIGPQQMEWLQTQLRELDGPVIVFCHQPLAGPACVDNAEDVQAVLNQSADKVLLTVNGHTHIDYVVRAGDIVNLHVNSASYYWVGGAHRHPSYSKEIHAKHRTLQSTCPYRDALFTTLTVDPAFGRVHVAAGATEWVGPSPVEVGKVLGSQLVDGEQVCPQIRERSLLRPSG